MAEVRRLDSWNDRCRDIANIYRVQLQNLVQVPVDHDWEECVYHNFVIRTDSRDALIAHLKSKGVDTRIHYPIPIHLQTAAKELGYSRGDFPNAERYANSMISLPIYPELSDVEVDYVVACVVEYFKGA